MNEKARELYDGIFYRGLNDMSQLDELLESIKQELLDECEDNKEMKEAVRRVF